MGTIFHIDCNNAFLSWEAAYQLTKGKTKDIRLVPSVIAGNPSRRKGIVLACSYPAKILGIKTAMTINDALRKCPKLLIFPPDYETYIICSNELCKLLLTYTPLVERYSIDECFIDVGRLTSNPLILANIIRKNIYKTLGFTVNVGVSNSKLLAKTASSFTKPNLTHSLFSHELDKKYFPLPVYQLFMVGMKTCIKLYKLGYKTIGQVANEHPDILRQHFNLFGLLLWNYANGIDHSVVNPMSSDPKGIGNALTLPEDISEKEIHLLHPFLLSLSERCTYRLRSIGMVSSTIQLGIKTNDFRYQLHQKKSDIYTDETNKVYTVVKRLLQEMSVTKPIRHVQLRLSGLTMNKNYQINLFEKENNLDASLDILRNRFGEHIIKRATFIHSGINHMAQSTHKDYPKIKSNILGGK